MPNLNRTTVPPEWLRQMLYNIQALRAFAAYAVVCHHILSALRDQIAVGKFFANPHIGATGVNVFFVISGLIMAHTTVRPISPANFLYHRIVRIVPIYWALTVVALILIVSGFAMFGHHQPTDWREAITSFLFVPDFRPGIDKPNGPALFVGWSLNFEMMFYGMFAVALLGPRDRRLVVVTIAILGLWLAHFVSANQYVRWLGDDIILCFAAGVVLWRANLAISPTKCVFLILAGLLILASPDLNSVINTMQHRELPLAIGATMLVSGAVGLERSGLHLSKGALIEQGNASYSLYLIHPFVIQAMGKLATKTGLNQSVVGLSATVTLMFIVSLLVATVFHKRIESPITALLRRAQATTHQRNTVN